MVVGVAGGLENVEVREEKSRTGEDIATDVLEGHNENEVGMEGGEDAKLRPRTRSSFATIGRVLQIKLLTSKKRLNICVQGQKHVSPVGLGHGFFSWVKYRVRCKFPNDYRGDA